MNARDYSDFHQNSLGLKPRPRRTALQVARLHVEECGLYGLRIVRVESREAITPRPSRLDPGVRLSSHPAPDNLGCSCGCNRGRIRESPSGYLVSSLSGYRQCDGGEPVLPQGRGSHSVHKYGFVCVRSWLSYCHRVCYFAYSNR